MSEYRSFINVEEKNKIHNWLSTNNFCAMPFFHVAIESNGDVRPCCLGDPLFNAAGMPIIDVINHPEHIKFRQSFLNNEQHPACNTCWGDYHNDKFSGRYVYSSSLKVYNEVAKIMQGATPEQKLVWLEIKAGNRCNLACRICGLWNSAKWLKESYELQALTRENYPEFKDSSEFKYNQQAKWIDDINFWKNIEGFDDIKIIHLMGGEPLMIEEHYEMLRAIAEKFDPSKIIIWYNTNGTIIPGPEEEKLLSKFKKIFWSVSIDDFGDKFNYQRSGASWDEVKKNLPYFFSKDNFESTIDTTISIYNIATIHEFVKELQSMGLSKYFSPHYVTTTNGYSNVRTLHPAIKVRIKEKLLESKFSVDENFTKEVDIIIDYMMFIDSWSSNIDEKRKREIKFIDKKRNENFVETFPEMAELLGYE